MRCRENREPEQGRRGPLSLSPLFALHASFSSVKQELEQGRENRELRAEKDRAPALLSLPAPFSCWSKKSLGDREYRELEQRRRGPLSLSLLFVLRHSLVCQTDREIRELGQRSRGPLFLPLLFALRPSLVSHRSLRYRENGEPERRRTRLPSLSRLFVLLPSPLCQTEA